MDSRGFERWAFAEANRADSHSAVGSDAAAYGQTLGLASNGLAALLQRVFEVDALRCPGCGTRMRVLSAITDPEVARRILDCLRMPSRAPPLADSEPRAEERFAEPSSELDWRDDPGFGFDQSGPDSE